MQETDIKIIKNFMYIFEQELSKIHYLVAMNFVITVLAFILIILIVYVK